MINFKQAELTKKLLLGFFFVATFFAANAYSQAKDIGGVASTITSNIQALTNLISAGAYLGGTAMFLIAVFQFRQHKENPTQVPLSKPMMFMAIAGALLFMPSLIAVTGGTIFGGTPAKGNAMGTTPP